MIRPHRARLLPPHLPEKAIVVLGTLLAVLIAAFLHENLSADRARPQRTNLPWPALDALRPSVMEDRSAGNEL